MAIVAIVSAAGLIWIARYDPFAAGSFGFAPRVERAKEINVTWMSAPAGARIYRIPGRLASRFTYRVSVTNEGSRSVVIESMGLPPDEQRSDAATIVPIGVVPDLLLPGKAAEEPFHAFDLPPGGEAAVTMEVRLRNCSISKDSKLSFGPLPITFSVFGIGRHSELTPDVQIEIVGPGPCDTGT